jgi:Family of unknown function (DUF6527)
MKLEKLNPMLSGADSNGFHELTLTCPICQRPFPIRVRLNESKEDAWTLKTGNSGWDDVTISPSIANHPCPKGKQCTAHFQITNGEVIVS